jgi:TonB family protein
MTLIVCKLDRLARSMKQLIETIENLRIRGIGFRSLTLNGGTANADRRGIFATMKTSLAVFRGAFNVTRFAAEFRSALHLGGAWRSFAGVVKEGPSRCLHLFRTAREVDRNTGMPAFRSSIKSWQIGFREAAAAAASAVAIAIAILVPTAEPPIVKVSPPPESPPVAAVEPPPLLSPPAPTAEPPIVEPAPRPVLRGPERAEQANPSPPVPVSPIPSSAPPAQTAYARVPAPAPSKVSPDYRALLGAWLASHKRYPEQARERGEEGRAVLQFTVDRSGRVLHFSVTTSSGYAELDAAVESMMRGASLPPFPADMPQSSITVSVPIRFSLHR